MTMRAKKVIVVLASGSPERPSVAATGLVYAQTARALDLQVEVHLTGQAVRWAFANVAGTHFSDQAQQVSILSFIERCCDMKIPIYVCGMAMREYHSGESLIEQISGQAGTTAVVGQLIEPDSRVLVF